MIEILKKYCTKENGLFLFNPPTGSGKTHAVLTWIYDNYETYCEDNKKIFFITNLKKNLPFEELRDNFFKPNNKLKKFEEDIIFLDSNSECLVKHFKDIKENEIPKDFKNHKVFKSIKENVTAIQLHKNKTDNNLKSYVEHLKEKLRTELEPQFRQIIEKRLKDNYHNREERINAITTEPNLKWIGELYPAVFTSKRKVFFLSIDKFYHKNSTLVEASYSFLESDLTKDAIIFIDEFDATKDNILNNIIEKGKNQQIDYISFFNHIYWALSKNVFPQKFITHSKKREKLINVYDSLSLDNIQDKLLKKSEDIVKDYQLDYSFKTQDNDINQRNLLFHDFHYHSVYRNNKKYIRLNKNDESKVNEIFFEDEKQDGKNIVYLLNKIKGFITYFCRGLKSIAENYQQLEMEEREKKSQKSEFTFDLALSTVIEEFGLEVKYKNFLIDNILNAREKPVKVKSELNYDLSIYEKGFRFYDFVDDYSHNSITKIFIYSVHNTPEKFILKLAEKAKVIGISATALLNTVTGNYDIKYFKRQLGRRFLELSDEDKNRLKALFEEQNKGYSNINVKLLGSQEEKLEQNFEDLFDNKELANDIISKIKTDISENYIINRYFKISSAFKQFLSHDDIQGFLCLLNKEPKQGDKTLDLKILENIFTNLIDTNNLKDKFKDNNGEFKVTEAYTIINSNDFDSKKQELIKRLEDGKKIFIISTYKTLGAGQNLQFKAPDPAKLIKVNDLKWNTEDKTDINAIYLDKPTHIIQHINEDLNEEGFIKYLFQLEFLAQVGILSISTLNEEVTRAFRCLLASSEQNKNHGSSKNELYKNDDTKQHYAKYIIQAIGRICRTNLKAKNIYIYADQALSELIQDFDKENTFLLKEFEALLQECKKNHEIKEQTDIQYKNLAKTQNKKVYDEIQKFISHKDWKWNEKRIEEWNKLRNMCMMYPTISNNEINSKILDLYIELPKESNQYYFNITNKDNNDFEFVDFDFESNNGSKVSSEEARLEQLIGIEGVKQHFKNNGWATSFKNNKYIIPPVIFNNIYKGALGEEIGKFILENICKITLEKLASENYELFDYKIKDKDIYIDFKHWKETTKINFNEENIRNKLTKVNGKKVFIINILSKSKEEFKIIRSSDEKIIEIPYLWNSKNKFSKNALDELKQYANQPQNK